MYHVGEERDLVDHIFLISTLSERFNERILLIYLSKVSVLLTALYAADLKMQSAVKR
ncbi:hypothetical protein VT99_11093 [Candidatus Electrothrix marina]|uniref:Uncharacterized protein n=1 Tax=Candidatus Electrothrix marina TaxID=1859130 RepID=A0A3S3RUI3_9BACT|nr:hypothetical protein VT99_11093 [Candidatus Electrothrix marina]